MAAVILNAVLYVTVAVALNLAAFHFIEIGPSGSWERLVGAVLLTLWGSIGTAWASKWMGRG